MWFRALNTYFVRINYKRPISSAHAIFHTEKLNELYSFDKRFSMKELLFLAKLFMYNDHNRPIETLRLYCIYNFSVYIERSSVQMWLNLAHAIFLTKIINELYSFDQIFGLKELLFLAKLFIHI